MLDEVSGGIQNIGNIHSSGGNGNSGSSSGSSGNSNSGSSSGSSGNSSITIIDQSFNMVISNESPHGTIQLPDS